MSPYQNVYAKDFNSQIELKHKEIWAINKMKMDMTRASNQRLNEFNVLDEFLLKAYECSAIYKEKVEKYHDQRIENTEFAVGDIVLLLNSRMHLLHGKLKSKWIGPFA